MALYVQKQLTTEQKQKIKYTVINITYKELRDITVMCMTFICINYYRQFKTICGIEEDGCMLHAKTVIHCPPGVLACGSPRKT